MSEIKNIPISKLQCNTGQIEGLPKNPRFIKDYRFEALKKSIQDAPEMLSLRELIAYPHGGKYVVIGGNMRLRACKELGFKEVPCKVLDERTPADKLREYTIKDNNAFGDTDFDLLANEWDTVELADWGVEFPSAEIDDLGDADEPDESDTTPVSGGNFNYEEQYGVIVKCANATEQEQVYNRLTGEGFECKVVSV